MQIAQTDLQPLADWAVGRRLVDRNDDLRVGEVVGATVGAGVTLEVQFADDSVPRRLQLLLAGERAATSEFIRPDRRESGDRYFWDEGAVARQAEPMAPLMLTLQTRLGVPTRTPAGERVGVVFAVGSAIGDAVADALAGAAVSAGADAPLTSTKIHPKPLGDGSFALDVLVALDAAPPLDPRQVAEAVAELLASESRDHGHWTAPLRERGFIGLHARDSQVQVMCDGVKLVPVAFRLRLS